MQKLVAENASMMWAIQKLMAEIESLKQRVTANAANTVEMTEQPVPVVEDEEDISDDAPVNDRPAPKKRAVTESSFKQQTRAAVQENKMEIQNLKAEVRAEFQNVSAKIQSVRAEIQSVRAEVKESLKMNTIPSWQH